MASKPTVTLLTQHTFHNFNERPSRGNHAPKMQQNPNHSQPRKETQSFLVPSLDFTPITPFSNLPLLSLLRKLDPQDQVPEAEAVHLIASLDRVVPIRKANKRKALRQARVAVLGQEDARDAAEPLEHVAQFLLFRHLGDL